MDSEDEDDNFNGLASSSHDPSLLNVDFNDYDCEVKGLIKNRFAKIIDKLNSVAMGLNGPKAKKKLSNVMKEGFFNQIIESIAQIEELMIKLNLSNRDSLNHIRGDLASSNLIREDFASSNLCDSMNHIRGDLASPNFIWEDSASSNFCDSMNHIRGDLASSKLIREDFPSSNLCDSMNHIRGDLASSNLIREDFASSNLCDSMNHIRGDLASPNFIREDFVPSNIFETNLVSTTGDSINNPISNNNQINNNSVNSLLHLAGHEYSIRRTHQLHCDVPMEVDVSTNNNIVLTTVDSNKKRRKRKRRCYGDLQRRELQTALNKIMKLERSVRIYSNNQSDLTKIKTQIINCDEYKKGSINIDNIVCNHKGRITIICQEADMVDLVRKELKSINLESFRPKINNVLLCSHGIPSRLEDSEILEEIYRNKKFNKENFRIVDKFRYTDATYTVIFSVNPDVLELIIKNPNLHIKAKKFNVFYFVKLIQCFNCAEFGHFGHECSANSKCVNCGGDHDKINCTSWNYTPRCANCIRHKYHDTGGSLNHASWDVSCPYRKKFIQLNRIRFNYG